jgi:hypothetical protein
MIHKEYYPYLIVYRKFEQYIPSELKVPEKVAALYIKPKAFRKHGLIYHSFDEAYLILDDEWYIFKDLLSFWVFLSTCKNLDIYTYDANTIIPLIKIKKEDLEKAGDLKDKVIDLLDQLGNVHVYNQGRFKYLSIKEKNIKIKEIRAIWDVPKKDLIEAETDNKVSYPSYIEENEYIKITKAIYDVILDVWDLFKEMKMHYFYPFTSTNAFHILYKHGVNYYGYRGENTAYEIVGHRGGLIGMKDVGYFEGGYYKLDINSAYPYAMLSELPYGLVDSIEDPSINDIKDQIGIFDIEYVINKPLISVKFANETLLGSGKIRSIVTTPELEIIKKYGSIKKIHKAFIYSKKAFLKDIILELYNLRQKHRGVKRKITKVLMNAIYGKFSQTIKSKGKLYLSSFAFPAISTYITGIIRTMLINLIEKAGWGNVFYFDTDGLIVNEKGFERLKDMLGNEIGKLKIEEKGSNIEIIAPKFYSIDGKIKFAGIPKDAVIEGDYIFYMKREDSEKNIRYKEYISKKSYKEDSMYLYKNFPSFEEYNIYFDYIQKEGPILYSNI